MDLKAVLDQVINSGAADEISKRTGIDVDQVGKVAEQGLPMLMKGKSEEKTAKKVAKKSGIDAGSVMQIITMLAPVVMMIMNNKKGGGLDFGAIGDVLGGGKSDSKSGNPWMDMANQMFDTNKNGTFIDDILGRFFGKK